MPAIENALILLPTTKLKISDVVNHLLSYFPPKRGRPAQSERIGPVVVFTLDWIFFAALVEAKDFVGQIKKRGNHLKIVSSGQAVHQLGVHLGVRKEVDVAIWPLDSTCCAIQEVVGPKECVVVR